MLDDPDVLWHFTCEHAREAIGEVGTLLPISAQQRVQVVPIPRRSEPLLRIVWATDLDVCRADALGLTSRTLVCDRTAHRYAVPAERFTRWGRVRRWLDPELVDGLELADGAEPAHWFVSFDPVPAVLADPVLRRAL